MSEQDDKAFKRNSVIMSGPKLLAYYVSGLQGAVNRGVDKIAKAIDAQTKDQGKWAAIQRDTLRDGLAAIALAAADPEDNTEEVQAQITALTNRAKAVADVLEDAATDPDNGQ